MQNSLRSELNFYNRELDAIQKSLSIKNLEVGKHSKSQKTFLKPKSDLSAFNKHGTECQTEIKAKKLRLTDKKFNQFNRRFNKQQQTGKQQRQSIQYGKTGMPIKCLDELEESYIYKNDSSVLTRQENHKIILEIHDLDIEKQLSVKASPKSSQLEYLKRLKKQEKVKGQQIEHVRQHSKDDHKNRESECATEDLLQKLKQRNKIYELARTHNTFNHEISANQIQKMWSQYQIYQKIIALIGKNTY